MPQLLLAAEELSCSLFPPQPQASLALAGARSQGGMILTLETSPATPPRPTLPGLVLIFSHLSTFSACSSVSWQAVNQSPGLCGRALLSQRSRGRRCFGGVGRNYLGSKGNHPACVLCWPLLHTLLHFPAQAQLLCGGFFPAAEHPRSGRCRLRAWRAMPEDGCASPAGGAWEGIHHLCSWRAQK